MTTREKLERKLEKRKEWAGKASEKCSAEFETARKITENIPFGQPILVGHHSERMHRRDIERSASHMDKGCAEYRKAEYHEEKARGLQDQLDRTIFSDDEDAVERLQERIDERKATQERYKAANKIIRGKSTAAEKIAALVNLGFGEENARERVEKNLPIPAYALTNNNGEIHRLEARIKDIKRRQAEQAEAEEAGGVIAHDCGYGYMTVKFAEKPDYEIIRALKSAGFYWSRGAWHGKTESLPACVRDLLPAAPAPEPATAETEAQA